MSDDRIAPKGKIWRCAACGKYAVDRYGIEGYRSGGWDESCMLNAVLIDANNLPMHVRLAIAAHPMTPARHSGGAG